MSWWSDTRDSVDSGMDYAKATIDGSAEDMASRASRDVDRSSYDVDAHAETMTKNATQDVDRANYDVDARINYYVDQAADDFDKSYYDVEAHADIMTDKARADAAAAAAAGDGAFYPGAGWTGDTLDKTAFDLGWGFDAAMAMLCAIPELIIGLKDALAGWFDVDVEQLLASFKDMQEKLKPTVEE